MNAGTTRARLERLCALRREITRSKRRIAVLCGKIREGDDDGTLNAEMLRTATALREYLQSAQAEETALIGYINSIDDGEVRELFMLRYVDGVRSWQRIAFLAGEHDESYVRRRHNAYLNRHAIT